MSDRSKVGQEELRRDLKELGKMLFPKIVGWECISCGFKVDGDESEYPKHSCPRCGHGEWQGVYKQDNSGRDD